MCPVFGLLVIPSCSRDHIAIGRLMHKYGAANNVAVNGRPLRAQVAQNPVAEKVNAGETPNMQFIESVGGWRPGGRTVPKDHLAPLTSCVRSHHMVRLTDAGRSVSEQMQPFMNGAQACAWTSTRAQTATRGSVGSLGSGGRAGRSTMNQLPICLFRLGLTL